MNLVREQQKRQLHCPESRESLPARGPEGTAPGQCEERCVLQYTAMDSNYSATRHQGWGGVAQAGSVRRLRT